VHRRGRYGLRALTMVERSRTSLVLCVVGMAIPLGNRCRLSRSSRGLDHIFATILSGERWVCQR
jgi:hypothetical protein